MNVEQLSLARQIDMVFREIGEELSYLSSGIVFIQIRNNVVGKFGVRHDPIETGDGQAEGNRNGLTEYHQSAFRQMGIKSLQYKKNWTHGEILYEFAIKHNRLHTSVQFESNYNMANLLNRPREYRQSSL